MLAVIRFIVMVVLIKQTSTYWEEGTTTPDPLRLDIIPRESFFRWQKIEYYNPMNVFWYFDWDEIGRRRALCVIAGLSIDMLPITTGVLLNRRLVLTAANALEPFMDRQHNMRIWALGLGGAHNTPYRYRVWRVKRILPKSKNPEHWHGIRGIHQPRHDVSLVFSMDQIYLYHYWPRFNHYAHKAYLTKRGTLDENLWFAGSGFEYLQHIEENYKIFHSGAQREHVVDCSFYLPKWWGKFICIKNVQGFPGLQNGGGLFNFGEGPTLIGMGCFEIRFNEDRILVFTDLRYYYDLIHTEAFIYPGDYYEYAYPEFGVRWGWIHDSWSNHPDIPMRQIKEGIYPLG